MRKVPLFLVVALTAGLVVVSPAEATYEPDKGFLGSCVITGTVIPFTDFSGSGTCTGVLYGRVVQNTPVTATATATGTSIDPLPGLQTGEGSLNFVVGGRTINFTFTQVGTHLDIKGVVAGEATGEVIPLTTSGDTRQALVVAETGRNLS